MSCVQRALGGASQPSKRSRDLQNLFTPDTSLFPQTCIQGRRKSEAIADTQRLKGLGTEEHCLDKDEQCIYEKGTGTPQARRRLVRERPPPSHLPHGHTDLSRGSSSILYLLQARRDEATAGETLTASACTAAGGIRGSFQRGHLPACCYRFPLQHRTSFPNRFEGRNRQRRGLRIHGDAF